MSFIRVIRLASAAVLAFNAACASAKPASNVPGTPFTTRQDQQLITRDAIAATQYLNAYEVVNALRGQWLRAKGTDSFDGPSVVQVYLGFQRLRGGVEELKDIRTSTIESMRYYDPVTATGRFGAGHLSGAIVVTLVK